MPATQPILVLGARGMVGSALVRALAASGASDVHAPPRAELDLLDGAAVARYFDTLRPASVYLAAAKVGGILANATRPVDFLYQNLLLELNVIHAAHRHGVRKLLFLGSTCIYPRLAPQPISEDALLSGPLEPTNEWYAIAKIAGIRLCDAYRQQYGCHFISAMPTNLYGPHDNFDPDTSHVLPALIRRFHAARINGADTVTVWGTGTPRREFMHVDDCASACLHLMRHHDEPGVINVGVGKDLTISELARLVADIVGYHGEIVFDPSKPDGVPRKLVDVSRLTRLGWQARIGLAEGIRSTYAWYRAARG